MAKKSILTLFVVCLVLRFHDWGKCLTVRGQIFWDSWTMAANNGAMVDIVDNVENESGFGRLVTIATVR